MGREWEGEATADEHERFPYESRTGDELACSARYRGFVCTRLPGHSGECRAHGVVGPNGLNDLCAVWDAEESE